MLTFAGNKQRSSGISETAHRNILTQSPVGCALNHMYAFPTGVSKLNMGAVNYAKLIIYTSKCKAHAEKRQSGKRNRNEIKKVKHEAFNSALFAVNRENLYKKMLK